MEKLIDNLYEQVKNSNAGEGHVKFEGFKNDPYAALVISMYNDQRPANVVLDELYNWAEENGLTMVLEKIHLLEKMD